MVSGTSAVDDTVMEDKFIRTGILWKCDCFNTCLHRWLITASAEQEEHSGKGFNKIGRADRNAFIVIPV
jgi:hypothetical protein